MKKISLVLALIVALVIILPGCDGGDSNLPYTGPIEDGTDQPIDDGVPDVPDDGGTQPPPPPTNGGDDGLQPPAPPILP